MKKRKLLPCRASIRLNVGGRLFQTSADTLSACDYFQPFLEGRMAHGTDGRGCLFLDRSPDLFAVLLQFLRTRSRPPESVLANKFALLCECNFFGCEVFAQVLRGESSPFDLRPDDRALRLREQFARRDACMYNLVDLFNTSTAVRPREELQIPILELSSIARRHLAVGSFQEVYRRLDSWSGHLIDDLGSIPGLVIAGVSVLSALKRTSAGDLDIFLTVSKAEAEATLRQFFSAVQRNHARNGGGKLLVTRTQNAFTMYRACGSKLSAPPVQVES